MDSQDLGRSRPMDDARLVYSTVRLFGIAYRTLGSAAQAEKVVQDVYPGLPHADVVDTDLLAFCEQP